MIAAAVREIGTSIDDLRQLDAKKPHPKGHVDKPGEGHKPARQDHDGEPQRLVALMQ